MVYRIVLSHEDRHDLREIKHYISLDSPQEAERFGRKLAKKTSILETQPEIGRVFPEMRDVTIREIVVGNYRVIYKVNALKQQIEIARYWHAARGVPKLGIL